MVSLTGGSFSKNDLENSSSREELSPLIDDEDANEQLPLKDIESFPRKKSSIFSSKSPDKESTSTNMFKFPPVSENHESSVEGTTTMDIEPFDSLDDCQNIGNINEVLNVTVTMPSEERYELQGLEYGNHLDHRLESTSSSNRANGLERSTNDAIINVEMPQNLKDMSSQLFNICKRGDIVCFLEEINFLYEHKKNCLYDVLLSQNEEDQDTLLHVAIKKGQIDLTKEILHILDEPYNSFYKDKYFQREKPLSKVINTKNREGKDVITLIIEDNNLECILTAFEYLTREDFNRKGERGYTPLHEAVHLKSSNAVEKLLESEHVNVEFLDERSYKARKYIDDEETAKLFIKYYNGKIDNLSKKVADSNRNLAQAEYILWGAKFLFAFLAASGSIKVYMDYYRDYYMKKPLELKVSGSDKSKNVEDGYDSIGNTIVMLSGTAGIVLLINTALDAGLYYFKGKNSIVKEELRNCLEDRYKVESILHDLRRREAFPHARANLAAPRRFQTASTSVYSPEQGYIG